MMYICIKLLVYIYINPLAIEVIEHLYLILTILVY